MLRCLSMCERQARRAEYEAQWREAGDRTERRLQDCWRRTKETERKDFVLYLYYVFRYKLVSKPADSNGTAAASMPSLSSTNDTGEWRVRRKLKQSLFPFLSFFFSSGVILFFFIFNFRQKSDLHKYFQFIWQLLRGVFKLRLIKHLQDWLPSVF